MFLVDFKVLIPNMCLSVFGMEFGCGVWCGYWLWQRFGVGGVAVTTVGFREVFLSADGVCHIWV